MITTVLLAATLSLGASPAAYDNAQAHQSYQVMVISHSDSPMTIHASLAPDVSCSVQMARTPTWAHMSGPAEFTLAAHAERKFIVSVGKPPPGQSELIAAFLATTPGKTGVHTAAGVGTALRFSEPGKTVVTPCPKPSPAKNPNIRTVTLGPGSHPSNNGPLDIAVGVLFALLVLGAGGFLWYYQRTRKGTGHE